LLGTVYAYAAAVWPVECCGLLAGPRGGPLDEVRPCLNAAATPRAYALGLPDLHYLAASLGGPRPAQVVYHSHTDASAAWSMADDDGARLGLDRPAWPLDHLVVDVRAGVPRGAALYHFDARCGRFARVAHWPAPSRSGIDPNDAREA
jgi:proteasome lid subunit RPN8/RPN11